MTVNEKKILKAKQKEISSQKETEVKALIKSQFNYDIPLAEVEKAGISTTGTKIDNELNPLEIEYTAYRKANNLWNNKFSKIAYEIMTDQQIYRIPITIKFNGNLSIEDLSEGEKKLLLIKSALEFAGQEDCLFILDEPDAHIHVTNKEEIVKMFNPYKHNRQIIFTTHSPTLTNCLDDSNLYKPIYHLILNGCII